MKLTPEEYDGLSKQASPKSKLLQDCLWAFGVGGAICLLGEILRQSYLAKGFTLTDASTMASVTLIVISAVTTSLGWYQRLAAKAGAGTLVPITGFANAMVSPALEFKSEGFVLGLGAKLFTLSGPVIAYGVITSVIYGVIYYFTGLGG